MTKEQIKNELIKRFNSRNSNTAKTSFEKASDNIVEILNQIITENNIELTDESKEELLVYLKPTNTELITSAINSELTNKLRDSFK